MTKKPTYINFPMGNTQPEYPTKPPPYTENYRIYRQPRPLPGEPLMQLPKGIAIDISRDGRSITPTWYRLFPATVNTLGGGPFDILFDTSGRVVSGLAYEQRGASPSPFNTPEGLLTAPTAPSARICLWVRDTTLNTPGALGNPRATDPRLLPPGDNTIICVYTKTGLIAPHPVDPSYLTPNSSSNPNSWNPFAFTQDAQSSGN